MTELNDLLFDVEMNRNPALAVSAQSYQIVGTIPMPSGIHGCDMVQVLNTCSERFNLKKNGFLL